MSVEQRVGSDGIPRPVEASGAFQLHGPATITASFTSSTAVRLADRGSVIGYVLATGTGGTAPTLSVVFQDSPDGTNYADIVTLSLTAVGTVRVNITQIGLYVRATASLGGTTPTFSSSEVWVLAK